MTTSAHPWRDQADCGRWTCNNAGGSSPSGTVTSSYGDPIMRRSIGSPLALFGLLLALAMVCATSAQGPKPEAPVVDPSAPPGLAAGGDASTPAAPAASSATPANDPLAPHDSAAGPFADPSAPRPVQPSGDASSPFAPRGASSADPFAPRGRRGGPFLGPSRPATANTPSGRVMPLVVGRYQAVSHNGKLIVIDTATGECFSHNGSAWGSIVPPIDSN
jgi:hypothetical protein